MKRYALVTLTWERDNPAAYMPGNYEILAVGAHPDHVNHSGWRQALIGGEDVAGWTLDDYVLPRLASGGMYGHEICGGGDDGSA